MKYWSIIITLIRVKYLLTSFRQPNYRAIDSVNLMKSSNHTNDDKANCKYKTISFYVFTLPNASNYNNWIHIWIINGGFSFYEVLRPLVLVVTPGHLCSRKSADGHLAKPFLSFQLLSRDSTIHMGKAIHRIQLGYWKACQNKINLLFNMYLQKKNASN